MNFFRNVWQSLTPKQIVCNTIVKEGFNGENTSVILAYFVRKVLKNFKYKRKLETFGKINSFDNSNYKISRY